MVTIAIISIIILASILLILLILKFIESRLTKEVKVAKTKRDELYQRELDNVDLDKKDVMTKLDAIARNFFFEAYNLAIKEYSEMEIKFKKMKNKEGERFCKLMSKHDYSQEEISSSEKAKLKKLLRKITLKEHIVSNMEKEEKLSSEIKEK
jgi:hypothetical protein